LVRRFGAPVTRANWDGGGGLPLNALLRFFVKILVAIFFLGVALSPDSPLLVTHLSVEQVPEPSFRRVDPDPYSATYSIITVVTVLYIWSISFIVRSR
jgi:hypothetical protein